MIKTTFTLISKKTPHSWCLRAHLLLSRNLERVSETRAICDVPARSRTFSCIFDRIFFGYWIYSHHQTYRGWKVKPDNLWCRDQYSFFQGWSHSVTSPYEILRTISASSGQGQDLLRSTARCSHRVYPTTSLSKLHSSSECGTMVILSTRMR
jgi:hypothetical protein